MPSSETRRARDSAATRAAILTAARGQFAAVGYERAGLRDIAAVAGVNVALVARYFGSKEELFRRAVTDAFALGALLDGERPALGLRLASAVLQKESGGTLDPLLALLRSASTEPAASLLRASLDQGFIRPLADWLGDESAEVRAGLIAAQLMGLAVCRFVVGNAVLAGDPGVLLDRSARQLQTLIDS
jgi:AcrR family transcriptional regulator